MQASMQAGIMSPQHLLPLAKQGNPTAIVILINQILRPKGIVAKADLQGSCLHMKLEARQIPDPEFLSAFIQLGLLKLEPEPVETVIIYGHEQGTLQPAWKQKIHLRESTPPLSVNPQTNPGAEDAMPAVPLGEIASGLASEAVKVEQLKQPRIRKAVQTANRQVFVKQFITGLLITVLGVVLTTTLITLLDSAERGKFLQKGRESTGSLMR